MTVCTHKVNEPDVLCGYPQFHPVHYIADCQGYHSYEGERLDLPGFVEMLAVAQDVLEHYKRDRLKWWRRMDGTPILNDIAVRMAEAFARATAAEVDRLTRERDEARDEYHEYIGKLQTITDSQ